MIYALIKDGIIVDRIVATQDFIDNNLQNLVCPNNFLPIDLAIDVTNLNVNIGYTYDGTDFYPPIENDEEIP